MLGLTCEASCRTLHGSVYSKVHFAHHIAQKFSRRGWALRQTSYCLPLIGTMANQSYLGAASSVHEASYPMGREEIKSHCRS